MAMLLGKKVGMTRVYDEAGRLIPVTVIQAGPCTVTQIKTSETDGYNAIQLGFEDVKPSRRTQPAIGHARKASTDPKKFVREWRLSGDAKLEYQPGDSLTVAVFAGTKLVDIIGTSKGKGFAGPMKRYGFKGFPASHGTERKHRAPGSIAARAMNAGMGGGLKRGKHMGGHMGDARVTTKNHVLVAVDEERNLLVVKGTVPGPAGGYCIVKTAKSLGSASGT
ncbi:MAG: 50S ribosomal protein L3 [Planctomycetes bacterium]|jgi:large subunit ribosomal protein L3|nr:50S ribosomal protein L3 [Planctomycetota bacterium]